MDQPFGGYIYLSLVTLIREMTKKGYFVESFDNDFEIEIIIKDIETGQKTATIFNYEVERINFRKHRKETVFNLQNEKLIIKNRLKRAVIEKFIFQNNLKLVI